MAERYVLKHPAKRFLVTCLDALGSLYRRFVPCPAQDFDPKEIKKILLIRLDHLGDAVMVRPALDAVRDAFPEAAVDFLVSGDNAVLFTPEPRLNIIACDHHWFSRRSTLIQQCLEMEDLIPKLRREHYDLGIDFRGDLRHILMMTLAGIPERAGYGITGGGFLLTRQVAYDPKLHQVDSNLKVLSELGIKPKALRRPFLYGKERAERLSSVLNSRQSPKIVLHGGAGLPEKRWPIENYQALIERILSGYSSAQIFLIGTREEQTGFPVLEQEGRLTDLRGKTKLEELPALFNKADFYIGNDSGPAHLAAFQGLPGIIIFNAVNDPEVWRPWSERFKIISHAQLSAIPVEQVFEAFVAQLPEKAGRPA